MEGDWFVYIKIKSEIFLFAITSAGVLIFKNDFQLFYASIRLITPVLP